MGDSPLRLKIISNGYFKERHHIILFYLKPKKFCDVLMVLNVNWKNNEFIIDLFK